MTDILDPVAEQFYMYWQRTAERCSNELFMYGKIGNTFVHLKEQCSIKQTGETDVHCI